MMYQHWHDRYQHHHIHVWKYCSACGVKYCYCGTEMAAGFYPWILPDPWITRPMYTCSHTT